MKDSTRNGNAYTLAYAAALILAAAALLSVVAVYLGPRQQSNRLAEERLYVLRAVHLEGDYLAAKDRNAYIDERYTRFITDTAVTGELLPIYLCRQPNATPQYVIPLHGQGLWGPIWGYLAIDSDRNTICGAVFDHKGETPGLGAEISTAEFGQRFEGKTLFKSGRFISITLSKKGSATALPGSVDAISGGTLTSRGVENMIRTGLEPYIDYLQNGK